MSLAPLALASFSFWLVFQGSAHFPLLQCASPDISRLLWTSTLSQGRSRQLFLQFIGVPRARSPPFVRSFITPAVGFLQICQDQRQCFASIRTSRVSKLTEISQWYEQAEDYSLVSKGHQRVGGVICPAHTLSDGDSVTGCDSTQPLAWSSEAVFSILLKHLGETWGTISHPRSWSKGHLFADLPQYLNVWHI